MITHELARWKQKNTRAASLARVPKDQVPLLRRGRSLPGAARLVARGEAVPVSLSVTKGCPSAHTAPAGVTMDPQEEVRAAQDEVKQLKAQLAALQQLQASPPKLRQGLKIPGLKNTGTTLNYIADGAGIRDNDPLNRPR